MNTTTRIRLALELHLRKKVIIIDQDWYPAPSYDGVITYCVNDDPKEYTIICVLEPNSISFC
jgi:hypothetical protein